MGLTKLLGLAVFLVAFSSCGASFGYRYYTIIPSEDKLLGPDPKDDRKLSECEPDKDAKVKVKCVVMFIEEFENAKLELKLLRQKLKDCQKQGRRGE